MTEPQSFLALAEDQAHGLDVCRALFEASPVATLVVDDQGRITDANPAACGLLAARREQVIGRSIKEFMLDGSRAFDDGWEAFRAEKSQNGELTLVRAGGERRTVRFSAIADFVPGMHVSFLEDISEHQAAAAECRRERASLQASEARFRALADSLAIMIWAEDAEGRVQYSNRHWFEYSGRAPGPDGLQDLELAIHPDDLQPMHELLSHARSAGERFKLTVRLRRHDGVYRAHSCLVVPIRDEAGQVVRRIGSATDIQDQRDAIEALKYERALRERFVASLSHDLRSPLTAAKMGAQLLMRSADRPDRLQLQSNRVIRNIDRADQLIQNLLDVTRITAGEPLVLERDSCDIAAIAREVVEDQSTIHGDRLTLDAPAAIVGAYDGSALRRTFENLIGNAIKYAEPNTEVTVKLAESATEVRISIHNEGPPISIEDQAFIFQPFRRASGGSQRSVGWGLGLTAVRGIAQAHGGDVHVESTQDRGTTFTVALPKAVAAAADNPR